MSWNTCMAYLGVVVAVVVHRSENCADGRAWSGKVLIELATIQHEKKEQENMRGAERERLREGERETEIERGRQKSI